MVHDLQIHSLHAEPAELERCAIQMGYGAEDRKKAVESFQANHQRHTEVVHCTFQSLFVEPKTSPTFEAILKTIGVKPQQCKRETTQRDRHILTIPFVAPSTIDLPRRVRPDFFMGD